MDPNYLLELTYRMFLIVLLMSLPVVLASVVFGVIVGIIQAVTQIQDQSIAYGIKLIAAIIVIALISRWAGGELVVFGRQVFESISNMR